MCVCVCLCAGRYGPYVQSQRLSKYRKAAEMLVAHGFAYKCFYTDEQVPFLFV